MRVLLSAMFLLLTVLTRGQNYARYSDIKPAMHDIYLENEGLRLANRRAAAIKCQEIYENAVIVSDGWQVVRDCNDDVTGLELHMELYGRTYDGKCGLTHLVFRRRLRGDDTFADKMTISHMGDFYNMECE